MTTLALYAATGMLTGFVVGLTGVGGGALMTPLLLLLFGVAPATAIGTDLWFAALTKLAIMPMHRGKQLVDWDVVRLLWTGSISASLTTIWWLQSRPVDDELADMLRGAIAIAVCLTALGLLGHRALVRITQQRVVVARPLTRWRPLITVIAGAVLGILVTLTSVGAGALGVVMLLYLYPSRLTPPRLVATDIVHAIPLAAVAGLSHLVVGNVDLRLLGALLAGSIPAALVATRLSSSLPHGTIRVALGLVLLIIGSKLALDSFR